jgi:hypothetical protein
MLGMLRSAAVAMRSNFFFIDVGLPFGEKFGGPFAAKF